MTAPAGRAAAARKAARARAATKNAAVVAEAGTPGHVLTPGAVKQVPWRTDITPPVLAFVVYVVPAAQGSKRVVPLAAGKFRLEEESVYVAPFRDAVRATALRAIREWAHTNGRAWVALDEPVMVSAVVTMPASAAAGEGATYHVAAPDLDKIERAIGDALSPTPIPPGQPKELPENARRRAREEMLRQARTRTVLHDDSRIATWDHCTKVFPGTTTDALAYPGVTIQIWRMRDLDAAARNPRTRESGAETMTAGDLANWGRPATGETWPTAAARLWDNPNEVLAAEGVCWLRGRTLTDPAMRVALRALALGGPNARIEVRDEPRRWVAPHEETLL